MGIADIFSKMNWSYLGELLISFIPALICIVFHEMSHGLAAYALGDDTAKTQGRLSLNPLRHLDPIGLLMLVFFHFGWAKPVSVDMRRMKNPKRDMALTALAGPMSNFVLAAVALFLFGLLYRFLNGYAVGNFILKLVQSTAYISVCLGLFNLIPIPPLDGSKVLFALLPDRQYAELMRYERYGMILLVVIMFTGVFGTAISNASYAVYNVLFNIADFAHSLTV